MAIHPVTGINGKELLFSVLRHEDTDIVPWVPFAGVHAGRLKGYTGREVLNDKTKLVEALLEVNKLYSPDGQPIFFDLQVEAEIYGCELLWDDETPPSVATHPLSTVMEIPGRLPEKTDGRLPFILSSMKKMKEEVGDHTALYGLITGPFTLASHLRGTEIFMDTFDHVDFVNELIAFCRDVGKRLTDFYIEAGMDVIAIVDPVVSQISPRHFSRFLSDPFSDMFGYIRDAGVFSSFFVCGDATKNIEVMCKTKPDSIAIDENIDIVAAKKITDQYNIAIEGNIPLTSRMLLGSQQDNMKYIVDLLDNMPDLKNFIVSPGCDMPYAIPVENTVGVIEAIRNTESSRLMLLNYQAQEYDLDEIALPDYSNLEKPLIEVFTLDSSSCPACGYMLHAAERAYEEMAGKVEMDEYKMTQAENIARMMKLNIKNLPSILINGEMRFSSVIPSNKELLDAIDEYL